MKVFGKVLVMMIILCGVLLISSEATAQCAMCRASVANSISDGGRTFGAGLNKGILYLMLMPYIIIAIIGYAWYKNSKKYTEQRKQLAKAFAVRFN